MSKVSRKVINLVKAKRGFKPGLQTKVLDFYHRNDVSTALLVNDKSTRKKRKRSAFKSEF